MAIKETELRIGNWVHHTAEYSYRNELPEKLHEGFNFQWNDRDWYALGECTLSLDNIEPIPLTPEILEQCGFECKVENENILKFKYGNNPVTDEWILIIVHFKEQNIFFYRNGYHQLKYFHQLQNLYFALTSQELQLKQVATV